MFVHGDISFPLGNIPAGIIARTRTVPRQVHMRGHGYGSERGPGYPIFIPVPVPAYLRLYLSITSKPFNTTVSSS